MRNSAETRTLTTLAIRSQNNEDDQALDLSGLMIPQPDQFGLSR